LAGNDITSTSQLVETAKAHQGQTVPVSYERNDQQHQANIALNSDEAAADEGYLGTALGQRQELIKAGWSAPITGVVTTAQFSWETLVGVKNLAVNTAKGAAMRISSDENTREEGKASLG